jgi:hypothetical protein
MLLCILSITIVVVIVIITRVCSQITPVNIMTRVCSQPTPVPALFFLLPARSTSLSILLAMMFFVSHNVPENKALPGGVQDTKKVRGGGFLGGGGDGC